MQSQLIESEFETTLDLPDRDDVPVLVRYSYWGGKGGDTLEEITVIDSSDGDGRELQLTSEQEKALIEEIWDDVRQSEDYA